MTYHTHHRHDCYLFDADSIDSGVVLEVQTMRWFEKWMTNKNVFIVSNKTYEQLTHQFGRKILEGCKAVFACSGNSIWMNNKEAVISTWRPPVDLLSLLEKHLKSSQFKIRSGPNIEYRVGLISFSVLGKTQNQDEIRRYVAHDKAFRERQKIIEAINEQHPNLYACYGDDTSIDICEKTHTKLQIVNFLKDYKNLLFIGKNNKLYQAVYSISKYRYNPDTFLVSWKQIQECL